MKSKVAAKKWLGGRLMEKILFQITKLINSYPVSLPIFSFLPLAVYPVSVKTYWWLFFLNN